MEIYSGTTLLRAYLSAKTQRELARRCVEIGAQPAGFYKPLVRGGAYMSIKMVCLGRHWNAKTYKYGTGDGWAQQTEIPWCFRNPRRDGASGAWHSGETQSDVPAVLNRINLRFFQKNY
jgi:hypothetical protein